MDNLERYNNAFISVFDVSVDQLNDEFTFKGVEKWDSVSHLALISELEDTFDVLLDSDDILHYESYENGKRILERMGISFEG